MYLRMVIGEMINEDQLREFGSIFKEEYAPILQEEPGFRRDDLAVVEPSEERLGEQLEAELAASRRHLWDVLDHYWEQDWRRRQHSTDDQPEDQLWRAAQAVREIEAALAARP